jgi:hypothetical protein
MKFTASENTGIEPETVAKSALITSTVDSGPSLFCTDPDPDPSINKQKVRKTSISTIS